VLILCSEGDIDGLTQVWHQGLDSWKSLVEVETLKAYLQVCVEEEEAGLAALQSAKQATEQTVEVTPPPSPQTALQTVTAHLLRLQDGDDKPGADNPEDLSEYKADDGTVFKWDEKSKEWAAQTSADKEADREAKKRKAAAVKSGDTELDEELQKAADAGPAPDGNAAFCFEADCHKENDGACVSRGKVDC
jgi:hypothetical protein